MTTLTVSGRLTAADASARELTALLLPFGEEGRTNLGRVTASADTQLQLAERLRGNLDHDRHVPVSFATVERTDAGLTATITVPPTPHGDRLLAEAAAELRTGVSVEIDDPVIRAGKLLGGRVEWYGHVVDSAFPSAQLLVAEDAGDLDDLDDTDEDDDDVDDQVDDDDTTTDDGDGADDDTTGDDSVTDTTTAPAGLRAQARGSRRRMLAERIRTPQDLFRLVAEANANRDTRMLAALSDITYDSAAPGGQGAIVEAPQWLGELWSGVAYQRRIVPLLGSRPLTSYAVRGWRWKVKPTMAPYAGNKAEIPSNPVEVEPYEDEAGRLAGGHDFDIKFRHFGDTEFIESYYRAMSESYALLSDEAAAADLIAAATPAATEYVRPAGLEVSDAVAKIVRGIVRVAPVGTPSFAVVGMNVFEQFAFTPADKRAAYLDAQLNLAGLDGSGVASGGFRVVAMPEHVIDVDDVLVGARQGANFRELGSVPIRVNALDLVRGGTDEAVFGYYFTEVLDPRALSYVTDDVAEV